MSVKCEEKSGVVILRLTGELDHQEMANIKNEVNKLLAQGKNKVVLDLNGIARASLMNIGVLVEQMRLLKSRGGDMKLVKMGSQLCEIFEKLGAADLFCRFKSDREAVADFRKECSGRA